MSANNQFRLIGLLWLSTTIGCIGWAQHVGWRQGYAMAEHDTAAAKVRHDAEMAKLGLCEWPKAFARETGCPGYGAAP